MGQMHEAGILDLPDDELRRLVRWHHKRFGFTPKSTSPTPVSLPLIGGDWEERPYRWADIDAARMSSGKSSLHYFCKAMTLTQALEEFDDFKFRRGTRDERGAKVTANPGYVTPRTKIPYIDDSELDQLVRWHKFKMKAYPDLFSTTPVIAPEGMDRWITRPDTWSAISRCRVMNGKSSVEAFCRMRGYIDVAYIPPPEDMVEEEEPVVVQATFAEAAAPDLSDAALLQYLLWHREKTGYLPSDASKTPVWKRLEGPSWVETTESWSGISQALAGRTRNVESPAQSINDFIKLNTPAITPDFLNQILRWSFERDGKYASSVKHRPVYMKSPEEEWSQSLLLWNAVEKYIIAHPDIFEAGSLAQYKKKNGFDQIRVLDTGIGWMEQTNALENAFAAASPPVPTVKLAKFLSNDYLKQLGKWHVEKEGCKPDEDSITPVWVKQEDGVWAHATTSWNVIIEDLKEQIRLLQLHLLEPRALGNFFKIPGPYRH